MRIIGVNLFYSRTPEPKISTSDSLETLLADMKAYGTAATDRFAKRLAALPKQGWRPISEAPKDDTVVDLWRDGERLTDYQRVDLGKGNVFYEPVNGGPTCVRDATHFSISLPPPPDGETT